MSELFHKTVGAGKNILFVHGWGVNSIVWDEQAAYFSKKNTVTVVDLPGHGASKPLDEPLDIDKCSILLSEFMREKGIKNAHLVGWSLGSQVIARTALELGKEYVRTVVFVGGTPCYIAPQDNDWGMPITKGKYFRRQLGTDFRAALGVFMTTFFEAEKRMDEKRTEKIRSLLFNDRHPPDERSALELLDSLYSDDIRSRIGELEIPSLVCHGDRDMITPTKVTELWKSLLKHGKTSILEDCGHAPFLTQPERFQEAVESFIIQNI